MKKLVLLACLIMSLGLLPAGAAQATEVELGTWYYFIFKNEVPSFSADSFTFDKTFPTKLTVVDILLAGDRFKVYDNDSPIGTTSDVENTGNQTFITNPEIALTNPELSRGFFSLPAGPHSLTFEIIQSPEIPAQGAFQVTAPLPSTVFLLGSSLPGLVWFHRRRQKKV